MESARLRASCASAVLVCLAGAAGAAAGPAAGAIAGVYDGAPVERLATGLRFVEGPVWDAAANRLLFTDIPANTIYAWSEGAGLTAWRRPSDAANGLALDRRGGLIACEHGSRTVTWAVPGMSRITIAARVGGRRLNSPNDLAVRSDGSVYFTDPPYGLPGGRGREIDEDAIYRFDPARWTVERVAGGTPKPNGIAFSPDEATLYVSYSDAERPVIRAFDVAPDGGLSNERVACECRNAHKRVPDGIKVDAAGRILAACDGVMVFAPDGTHLGSIAVPEVPANLAFGGDDRRTLFVTACTSLYRVRVLTPGSTTPTRH